MGENLSPGSCERLLKALIALLVDEMGRRNEDMEDDGGNDVVKTTSHKEGEDEMENKRK